LIQIFLDSLPTSSGIWYFIYAHHLTPHLENG